MLYTGKSILDVANENNFAIPAFNISDWAMFNGIIDISEELSAPVIVAIHPDEVSHITTDLIAAMHSRAHRASVPVAIHWDHGGTYEQMITAIKAGFTSVMIDASLLPFDENVALTRKVVEAAHIVGVSVEGEVGTIGPRDPKTAEELADIVYTTPAEAARFVADTGVDFLAVAVGTCHGVYPAGVAPKLKLELIEEIRDATSVPLVLHGGSGAPDDEVSQSVTRGVAKVNISADMKLAYFARLREVLEDPKHREPHDIYPPALDAVRDVVRHKVQVFGGSNTAHYYGVEGAQDFRDSWVGAPVLEH